jgi:hypothetical protein
MQDAIKHGAYRGDIAEQFAPVLDWTIRSHQRAAALVSTHDQQGHGGNGLHIGLASALGHGICQLVQQDMRLTVKNYEQGEFMCWGISRWNCWCRRVGAHRHKMRTVSTHVQPVTT